MYARMYIHDVNVCVTTLRATHTRTHTHTHPPLRRIRPDAHPEVSAHISPSTWAIALFIANTTATRALWVGLRAQGLGLKA